MTTNNITVNEETRLTEAEEMDLKTFKAGFISGALVASLIGTAMWFKHKTKMKNLEKMTYKKVKNIEKKLDKVYSKED